MVRQARKPTPRTVTIVKSRDFVVNRLLNPCQEGNHTICTGWAVLKEDTFRVNANYFLRCTCACHRADQRTVKKLKPKKAKKTIAKKPRKKLNKSRRRGTKSKRVKRR